MASSDKTPMKREFFSVADVVELMKGMDDYKIGMLEWDSLKLAKIPDRAPATSASSISLPPGAPPPRVTDDDAQEAIKRAKIEMQRRAEEKLQAARLSTGRARVKAAMPKTPITQAVGAIFDAASKSDPTENVG